MSGAECDETELSDVAVERTLALPEDRELVVDTDNRALNEACPSFACCCCRGSVGGWPWAEPKAVVDVSMVSMVIGVSPDATSIGDAGGCCLTIGIILFAPSLGP